jgi:hypothetical protein
MNTFRFEVASNDETFELHDEDPIALAHRAFMAGTWYGRLSMTSGEPVRATMGRADETIAQDVGRIVHRPCTTAPHPSNDEMIDVVWGPVERIHA